MMSWQRMEAPHYTLYYHQDQGPLPEITYTLLNDIYRDLSGRFGYVHNSKVPVVIYESPALFEQTNIITEILPEEAGGFTEYFKNRVVMPFNGSLHDFRHVLHHEMIHAFVFGMVYGGSIFRITNAQVPLWFNEGLAEVLSAGWNKEADMFMLDRVTSSHVAVPGPELNGYMAYKGGQSFLYYLYSTEGDSLFNRMLTSFKTGKNAEKAIEHVYKKKLEALGMEWIRELRRIYWPEAGRRISPESNSLPVTNNIKERSHINLRPRISPDGKLVAFYSDKKDYTRIIIVDTSGKEIRQIGQHGFGNTIESFQPFNSGMCWSPDGRQLAFTAKLGGRNEIRIVDVKSGKNRRTIKLPLSAINTPDWSKDGSKLVFTAIDKGQSDLYMYDLTTSGLKRLTNSVQSKSFPRFSPDGGKVIFSSIDTTGLAAGPHSGALGSTWNITIFDIDKDSSFVLTNTPWNDRQPVWSPDGNSFIFVSDRNGIDNLYLAAIDAPGQAKPLTDYMGNCSSPDWAQNGSAIVFDLFSKQAWNIRRMENPLEKVMDEPLALTRWAEHEQERSIPFFKKSDMITSAKKVDDKGSKKAVLTEVVDSVNITDSTDLSVSVDSVNTTDSTNSTDPITLVDSVNVIDSTDSAVSVDYINLANSVDLISLKDSAQLEKFVDSLNLAQINDTANTAEETDSSDGENLARKYATPIFKDFISADTLPYPLSYRLRFTPDLVIFGLGLSTYSGASGQWLAMFSDIMGDHRITLAGDVQANFNEYAQLYLTYHFLKYRVNTAIGGFYSKDYAHDGLFNRYYHDMEAGGFLGFSYPFSMFTRADLHFFGRRMERALVSKSNNSAAQRHDALLSVLSLSFDNILWGITGPLNGVRAQTRFHLSPALSFIDEPYIAGDVDMRHYWHIAKTFVWANRFTAGGSISLNDDKSARRFFLGGTDNWFNYDVHRANYDNNLRYSYYSDIVSPLRGWDYFGVTGDRMMLINSEFRFPFIREISTVWPLPLRIRYVNGAVFTDAGYAWDGRDQKWSVPLPSKLLCGVGFGMRANLGIFVLRYDRGWPTDWLSTGSPVNYFSLGAEF